MKMTPSSVSSVRYPDEKPRASATRRRLLLNPEGSQQDNPVLGCKNWKMGVPIHVKVLSREIPGVLLGQGCEHQTVFPAG